MPAAAINMGGHSRGYRLVVAGGSTGGHLFPGIAVAQAFKARRADNQVMFVNAGRPLEVQILGKLGWHFQTIPIEGIKGRSRWRQLAASLKIPRAIRSAARVLKTFRPDMVLGVGGYSAGPVVVAAWLLRIPTALHEQNQLPGVTNRLLGRIVRRIYLSFEDQGSHFEAKKVVVSGNPVRDELLMLGDRPVERASDKGTTILVIGGSQGAHAINVAMMAALASLKSRLLEQPGIKIIHQTGIQDEAAVRDAYAAAGIQATVQAFFDNMADHYQLADLIICRAGASTVAEITVIGKAAIFIPFPFAADDHQTENALALVRAGAAEMIPEKVLNGEVLGEKMTTLILDRPRLAQMAASARTLGRPEAAQTIVSDLVRLMENLAPKKRGPGRNEQQV